MPFGSRWAAWLKWHGNGADCRQEARRRGASGRGQQLLSDVGLRSRSIGSPAGWPSGANPGGSLGA
eukprot:364630-Chlamydomonas_euryale.AAC.7